MLTPKPHETEFEFTFRAHDALRNSIPNFLDRNKAVWDAWDRSGNKSPADEMADRLLGQNYVASEEPTCYFTEHDIPGPDGSVRKFGASDMQRIAEDANFDIIERAKFSAITDGHTSPDPHAPNPKIIGFSTRYRLGELGVTKPIKAVFAKERFAADVANEAKRLPRRSVELIHDRHSGRRIIDPIAALGARAPRLSMPGRYSVSGDVERYSFEPPTNSNPPGEKPMNDLSDDQLRQIIEAISQLPEIQFIRTQMHGAGGPAMPGAGGPPMPGAGGPPGAPPDAGGPPAGGPPEPDGDEKFSLDPIDRYALQEQRMAEMQRLLNQQANQITELANTKTDNDRLNKLKMLETQYYGFVDAEEEAKICLYSHNSTMTDDQFERHIGTIARTAAKAAILNVPTLPNGVDRYKASSNGNDVVPERYSEEFGEIQRYALELHADDINAGRPAKSIEEYIQIVRDKKAAPVKK